MNTISQQLKDALEHRENVRRTLENFDDTIKELRSQLTIKCACCNVNRRICDLEYIQEILYQAPSGCTDGDYHYDSSSSEFECPQTGIRNMLWFDTPYHIPNELRGNYANDVQAQFKRKYKSMFKSVAVEHEADRRAYWGNLKFEWKHNKYVNDNLELFDLRIAYDKDMADK
jgi:hypothetical protein